MLLCVCYLIEFVCVSSFLYFNFYNSFTGPQLAFRCFLHMCNSIHLLVVKYGSKHVQQQDAASCTATKSVSEQQQQGMLHIFKLAHL